MTQRLKAGHTAGAKTYKVHIDGFNFLPYLTGQADTGPRENFFYVSDEGQIMAIRMGDWKGNYKERLTLFKGMV